MIKRRVPTALLIGITALVPGVTAMRAVDSPDIVPRSTAASAGTPLDIKPEITAGTIWVVNSTDSIGGHAPQLLGRPVVMKDEGAGSFLGFNGESDGLVLPANPLAGYGAFTIEVYFKPEVGGQPEQRFVHLQDADAGRRALIELRISEDGQWCLDTYLNDHGAKLTLIDRTKLHPLGQWYWAALTYDGKTMTHYVNGVKEAEGEIRFSPMIAGETSLGMRLNKVSWFKGCLAEIRFHPVALASEVLQRAH